LNINRSSDREDLSETNITSHIFLYPHNFIILGIVCKSLNQSQYQMLLTLHFIDSRIQENSDDWLEIFYVKLFFA